jgi:uncharacterized protein with ParB-like and HNH nuclease domain
MEQKIIADVVLNKLNRDWLMPSLQREFVWGVSKGDKNDNNKIEKLFDSIMQHYPFGTILAWDVDRDDIGKWELYEFVKDYTKGQHNHVPNPSGFSKLYLILDGQQRLSALNIGLRGSYSFSYRGRIKKVCLCLNLLSNIENDVDNTYGLKYEFKFLEYDQKPQLDENNLWIKVGDVLYTYNDSTIAKDDKKDSFIERYQVITEQLDRDKRNKANKTLGRLYERFCESSVLNIETTDTKDDEMLLNIFVRTNDGGQKLEKSDLLLSYMESAEDLFLPNRARKEVTNFVDLINTESRSQHSFGFSKDDVLKAALVLSDLDIQYKLKNFNQEKLKKMSSDWEAIKTYLQMAILLISKFGFHKLSSKNSIIPIAYWLKKERKTNAFIDSVDSNDLLLKENIAKWFIKASLKRVFGGSSDSTLELARNEIKSGKDFSNIALPGKELTFDRLIKIVDEERYGSENSHLILALIADGSILVDPAQDHIHPKSKFNKTYYESVGIPSEDHEFFDDHRDSLANLHLLSPSVNREKTNSDFLKWIEDKDQKWRDASLIPDTDLNFVNFKEFARLRRNLLINKLCELLNIYNPNKK